MAFVDYLHRSTGDSPGWAGRGRAETARLLAELQRRWCAGGPLGVAADGSVRRQDPDAFLEEALLALPEHDFGAASATDLDRVLDEKGIYSVEALRAFRRLVAVRAATEAVQWAVAPAPRAKASAASVLAEIDDPGAAGRRRRSPRRRAGGGLVVAGPCHAESAWQQARPRPAGRKLSAMREQHG